MNDYQIVFLMCSERSGSNLIRVMLDAHSEVFAPAPLHFVRDIGAHFHATIVRKDSSDAWGLMRTRIGNRIERFYGKETRKMVLCEIDTIKEFSARKILKVIYETLLAGNSYKVLFIKENNIQRNLFFLLHYFPDAKFVFQVRDPRDFLASTKGLKSSWLGNKFGSNRRAMEVWREDQLGGLSALTHLGEERVFLQRYEDLIAEPEKVLSKLCSFLDLEFQQSMLDFHKKESTRLVAKQGECWKNLQEPLMPRNLGNYKTKLSSWQVRMIETYLGDIMECFGYQRCFLKDKEPSLFQIFWPHITEPFEKIINRNKRPFYLDGGDELWYKLEKVADPVNFPYVTSHSDINNDD